MTTRVPFGWLPEKTTWSAVDFAIQPLPDIDEAIGEVSESERINEPWFYPPIMSGPPERPVPAYHLPLTHTLDLVEEVDTTAKLSILLLYVLGLLKGMRLFPAPWVHFYRVPIKPASVVGFYVRDEAVIRILGLAVEFWRQSDSETRKSMIGALHWHMFGRGYEQPFEIFNAQYTVLDTCWRIHARRMGLKKDPPHGVRIEELCIAYQLSLPDWAKTTANKSFLSELRNDLLHEALWGGEPIGFAHPASYPGIHLELFAFNSHLLLALLGETSKYVRAPYNRNMGMIS